MTNSLRLFYFATPDSYRDKWIKMIFLFVTFFLPRIHKLFFHADLKRLKQMHADFYLLNLRERNIKYNLKFVLIREIRGKKT